MDNKQKDRIKQETAEELKRRIKASTSPFHTVLYVMRELDNAGFRKLELGE